MAWLTFSGSSSLWLNTNSLGLELEVNGYNDKMSVLLEKILLTVRDLELRQDRFDIIKERFEREYKNWGFRQPYYQVGDFTRYLLEPKRFITSEYATELPHVTLNDVKVFSKQLISQAHIELLVHGNVYREEAKKIANLIETSLKPRVLLPSQWTTRRNIILPANSNFVFNHKLDDPENVNHAIEYYLQIGSLMDPELRSRAQLFAQMTDEPSFDQLRTKEQLGYVVWSGVRPSVTMTGYRVLIQSERPPQYLEQRIDAFLAKFKNDLASMEQDDFEKHKRSLIARKLEKMKNLNGETGRLWNYILSEYYNFYQVDMDVNHIRKLTKQDMQEFYARYIDPESPTRAKLSIHLNAQKVVEAETSSEEQREQLVGMLTKYLTAQGAEVQKDRLQSEMSKTAPHDQAGIVAACRAAVGSSLPESKLDEVVTELEKAIPQVFVALKIKAPEQEVNGAEELPKVKEPVVIEDVHHWKASLPVSAGTLPVEDIKRFQDFESKL